MCIEPPRPPLQPARLPYSSAINGFIATPRASAWPRSTRPKTWLGNVTPWIFVVVMVATQIFNWLGAPPASKEEFAAMGLLAYGIVAVFGLMLDATREVIPREG